MTKREQQDIICDVRNLIDDTCTKFMKDLEDNKDTKNIEVINEKIMLRCLIAARHLILISQTIMYKEAI